MKDNSLKIFDGINVKLARSKTYNYNFNKINGRFSRWGATQDEDPFCSTFGPEILDIEISSGGGCLGNCPFCYKGNGGSAPIQNMTLDQFKIILNKMPKVLTQIAFGIMNISTNPDFFPMMEYARSQGVIPNYTCHGLDVTQEIAERTAKLCGAVAVSVYNKEKSYNAIKMFTDAGMTQVNIHFMLADETYDRALEIVNDIASDSRLKRMNAIVFLQLKKKGRAEEGHYHYIGSVEKYKRLMDFCKEKGVNYGFDSCSAPLYFKVIENDPDYKQLSSYGEPCESTLFSSYINSKGVFFPCSFSEEVIGWETGLNVLTCSDFLKDVWHHPSIKEFRKNLEQSSSGCADCLSQKICRSCPIYIETAGCKS